MSEWVWVVLLTVSSIINFYSSTREENVFWSRLQFGAGFFAMVVGGLFFLSAIGL